VRREPLYGIIHEGRVPTADKIIFAGLSILLERSISRQMLKNIQRPTRIWNTLSDVFIEHCPGGKPRSSSKSLGSADECFHELLSPG
jgi:hypothetical protein